MTGGSVYYGESLYCITPARNHHSLNVTYNAAGEIIHWKYGNLEEERIYEDGLLKERTGNNGAQYRYNYRYGKKPTDIHLPSGLQYFLQYDGEGNLILVRTPGLGRHYFHRLMVTGAQRALYNVPGLDLPYIEDYNGNGQLLQIIYPSEYRKVIFRYNQLSLPSLVLYGQTKIEYTYDQDISMASLIEMTSEGLRSTEAITYDSSLVDSRNIDFPDDFILLGVKFEYTYDKNFRLSNIKSTFSKNQMTFTNFTYDDTNGNLKSIKTLKFQRPLVDKEKIYDDRVVMSLERDMYGRMEHTQYMFRDNVRFILDIIYDEMNRVSSWSRRIGQTDICQTEYKYDIDGNLIEVNRDGHSKWKYGYDNNGNINRVDDGDYNLAMDYDVGDKIKTSGSRTYKFDQDGLMIQRHDEDLLFNSFGQLVSVTNPGSYKYSYSYDQLGRVIVQRDRLGNSMQYFYADVGRPQLVTHTYNYSNMELTQYYYSPRNTLIAFERQDKLHYIATDPMGSPIVIFDESDLIMKQMSYSPLGEITSDSNPNYEFSFGFQGWIYNPVTKLALSGCRVYDTMTGHFANPDYRRIMRDLQYLMEDPIMMNNYQYRYLVNVHLKHRHFPTLDTTEWLKLLGFDMDSMAPNVGYDGTVRPSFDLENHNLLPTSSAFECTFERDMLSMLSISTVPKSKVSPIRKFIPIKPAPLKFIYGDGVVMSIVNSDAVLSYQEDTQRWSKKLSKFLNNSEVLDLKYTINGRNVLYFLKPDASVVEDELRALGIQGKTMMFENAINVTVNRLSHPDGYRINSFKETDVRFHGNNSVINVRYGSNYDHERLRILRHAKERGIKRAWMREKWLIQNSLPSYHSWREWEKQEILSGHYPEGFDVQFLRSPEEYPELADDCNNIKFINVKR